MTNDIVLAVKFRLSKTEVLDAPVALVWAEWCWSGGAIEGLVA